jgi:hypothetical protein
VIPRICNETFQTADEQEKQADNVHFKITASMLEIYVERIYDLLIPAEEYSIKTREELFMQLDYVKVCVYVFVYVSVCVCVCVIVCVSECIYIYLILHAYPVVSL